MRCGGVKYRFIRRLSLQRIPGSRSGKYMATQGWNRGVWFKHATPKYSFHIWTAMRDRLSTCDRMLKWNPTINPICVLCQQSMETRNHLFFSCSYSSQILQKLVRGLLQSRYTDEWEDIVTLLLDNRQEYVRLLLSRYTFQATAHTIWWERNMKKHGDMQHPIHYADHHKMAGLRVWFGTR